MLKLQRFKKNFLAREVSQLHGYLLSCGTRVQAQCSRSSQHRVDSERPIMRHLCHFQKRNYSVRGPQHVWHMNGNHGILQSALYACIYASIISEYVFQMVRMYSSIQRQMVLTEMPTTLHSVVL